jgi:hypothetical protein
VGFATLPIRQIVFLVVLMVLPIMHYFLLSMLLLGPLSGLIGGLPTGSFSTQAPFFLDGRGMDFFGPIIPLGL